MGISQSRACSWQSFEPTPLHTDHRLHVPDGGRLARSYQLNDRRRRSRLRAFQALKDQLDAHCVALFNKPLHGLLNIRVFQQDRDAAHLAHAEGVLYGTELGSVTLKRVGLFRFPIKYSTHTKVQQDWISHNCQYLGPNISLRSGFYSQNGRWPDPKSSHVLPYPPPPTLCSKVRLIRFHCGTTSRWPRLGAQIRHVGAPYPLDSALAKCARYKGIAPVDILV